MTAYIKLELISYLKNEPLQQLVQREIWKSDVMNQNWFPYTFIISEFSNWLLLKISYVLILVLVRSTIFCNRADGRACKQLSKRYYILYSISIHHCLFLMQSKIVKLVVPCNATCYILTPSQYWMTSFEKLVLLMPQYSIFSNSYVVSKH